MILITFSIAALVASNLLGAAIVSDVERTADSFRLTPSELQHAQERTRQIEAARVANVDARSAARVTEADVVRMAADVIDSGVMLTFDTQSFYSQAELIPAARRRLDALVGFLMRHPERTIKLRSPPVDLSNAEAQEITARSAALRRHLSRAGITDERLLFARVDLEITAAERTAVQLVIEDSAIPRGIVE